MDRMFVTGPPDDRSDGGGLRVHSAAGRTFERSAGQVLNSTMRRYVTDMTAPYGLAVREDLLEQGVGHSYVEMCAPLLAELVPEDRPADLLVLATGIPDIRFGRSTSTVLSGHCAGNPMAFTVCDQGLLSAFTALHLINGYARTGDCGRAVLLVAEQPTVYHELPVPTPIPARAAAVGVVLETGESQDALSIRRHTKLAERDVPEILAAEISRLADDAPTVLLGAQLAELVGDVPEGQPFTGIWLELSRRLSGWQESGERLLLAEYDPALGHLFSATLRFGG